MVRNNQNDKRAVYCLLNLTHLVTRPTFEVTKLVLWLFLELGLVLMTYCPENIRVGTNHSYECYHVTV